MARNHTENGTIIRALGLTMLLFYIEYWNRSFNQMQSATTHFCLWSTIVARSLWMELKIDGILCMASELIVL